MPLQFRRLLLTILIGSLGTLTGCARESGSIIPMPSRTHTTQFPGTEEGLRRAVQAGIQQGHRQRRYGRVHEADLMGLAMIATAGRAPSEWWSIEGWEAGQLRGSSRFGPWGIPLDMARRVYGAEHGIDPRWTDQQVAEFLLDRPIVQVRIAADRLQRLYTDFGTRSPFALQSWSLETVPPQAESWRSEMAKLTTGEVPFARQALIGTAEEPRGILYWLAVAGEEAAIRETLLLWRSSAGYEWLHGERAPRRTAKRFRGPITARELESLRPYRREFATLNRIAAEVIAMP